MRTHDLLVIGGGPAGLSAALNGSAEGLATVLLEREEHFGGQAGTTSLVENYLGFPQGISGPALLGRAQRQSTRLGAELRHSTEVTALRRDDGRFVACDAAGAVLAQARACVLALGESFRHMPLGDPGVPVYYGARPSVHAHYAGKRVAVIGGGNSAGQAVLNLARYAARVDMVTRAPLEHSVSAYLARRIRASACVELHSAQREVVHGRRIYLDGRRLADVAAVFAYIGTEPHTAFLARLCKRDPHGFIPAADGGMTDVGGLFAIGDVRSASRKRIAAAVGEGSAVVASVLNFLT